MNETWFLEGAPDGNVVLIGPFASKDEAVAFDVRLDAMTKITGWNDGCSGFEPVRAISPCDLLPFKAGDETVPA